MSNKHSLNRGTPFSLISSGFTWFHLISLFPEVFFLFYQISWVIIGSYSVLPGFTKFHCLFEKFGLDSLWTNMYSNLVRMKDKSNQFFFYVLKVSYYWDGVLSNRIFCLIAFHSSYSGIFADLYDLILMEKKTWTLPW